MIDEQLSLCLIKYLLGFLLLLVHGLRDNPLNDALKLLLVAILDEHIRLLDRLVTHLMCRVNKQLRYHCLAGTVDLLLHLVVALCRLDLGDPLLDEAT